MASFAYTKKDSSVKELYSALIFYPGENRPHTIETSVCLFVGTSKLGSIIWKYAQSETKNS